MDFLSSIHQRVNVNGSFSDWSNVTSGVPQRSVLGSIPFIVYIMKMLIAILPLLQMTPSYIAGCIVTPDDSHII